jgi:hypothetical protein
LPRGVNALQQTTCFSKVFVRIPKICATRFCEIFAHRRGARPTTLRAIAHLRANDLAHRIDRDSRASSAARVAQTHRLQLLEHRAFDAA